MPTLVETIQRDPQCRNVASTEIPSLTLRDAVTHRHIQPSHIPPAGRSFALPEEIPEFRAWLTAHHGCESRQAGCSRVRAEGGNRSVAGSDETAGCGRETLWMLKTGQDGGRKAGRSSLVLRLWVMGCVSRMGVCISFAPCELTRLKIVSSNVHEDQG